MFATEYTITVTDLGRGCRRPWLPSRCSCPNTPTSRRSARHSRPAGANPREYAHTLDPFVALSAIAAVTTRIKEGTGICLVIQHDPIALAKVAASVDHSHIRGDACSGRRRRVGCARRSPIMARTRARAGGCSASVRAGDGRHPSSDEAEFHGNVRQLRSDLVVAKPSRSRGRQCCWGRRARLDGAGDQVRRRMAAASGIEANSPLRQRIAEFWELSEAAGRGRMPGQASTER